jgi:hypothetical protein
MQISPKAVFSFLSTSYKLRDKSNERRKKKKKKFDIEKSVELLCLAVWRVKSLVVLASADVIQLFGVLRDLERSRSINIYVRDVLLRLD